MARPARRVPRDGHHRASHWPVRAHDPGRAQCGRSVRRAAHQGGHLLQRHHGDRAHEGLAERPSSSPTSGASSAFDNVFGLGAGDPRAWSLPCWTCWAMRPSATSLRHCATTPRRTPRPSSCPCGSSSATAAARPARAPQPVEHLACVLLDEHLRVGLPRLDVDGVEREVAEVDRAADLLGI